MNTSLKQKFYHSNITSSDTRRNAIRSIKEQCTFEELCEIADSIKNPSNIMYSYFFGTALPRNYEELGKFDSKKLVFPEENNLHAEINWCLISIRKFKKEIQLFLEYKKVVENSILIGHYDLASEYLTRIETEICCSIWTLEHRFLLLEYSKSSEENKLFLSTINETNQGFFTRTLAYYISNRSEKNFSVSKYDSDIMRLLKNIHGNLAEANRQYYYYKLNLFEYNYTEYDSILVLESFNSVIDRYLTLVKVFKMLISSNADFEIQNNLKNRILYLRKNFDDYNLQLLNVCISPESVSIVTDSEFNIRIIDYYSAGSYREAIEEIREVITQYPNCFEYYILLVYSCIYSGEPLITTNESIQSGLLKSLYNYIGKLASPQENYTHLSRICKTLSAYRICDGLQAFIDKEFKSGAYWHCYNLMSVSLFNPYLSEYFNLIGQEKANVFLTHLNEKNKQSTTIQLLQQQINEGHSENLIELNIYNNRQQIERAKSYQKEREYDSAVSIWKELMIINREIVPLFEICVRNLFECYIQCDNIDDAITLYVDAYITNQFTVYKIKCTSVLEVIRKNKFRNVVPTIELPLFYSINNADENEIHIAYERYLFANDAKRPTDLFNKMHIVDYKKLSLFLRITCTIDLFKHSIFITGTKDGYTERIDICKQLLVIDKVHESEYRNELNSLTESLIIQEGLQKLDESKIYVNEQGLINSELKEYEGLFTRYKTIANIFKDESKQLVFFAKDGILATVEKNEKDELSDKKSKISSNPLKDFFKDIFDIVRDKFLYSKFGIAAYLSTRIRHGVLLGEIRPIFEKYNLISQKDSINGEYGALPYWTLKYNLLSQNDHNILQNEIAQLSENIDELIFRLIRSNLQIKSGVENLDGWLDYNFDDTDLLLYSLSFRESKSYNEFVRKVIEVLWLRTDNNLKTIRERLQKDIKNEFVESINKFTSNLKVKLPNAYLPEIYTNSMVCTTDVQNALDKVASWFNRTGSQTSDFYIDKIINIVVKNVNHSYRSKQISLSSNIEHNIFIKGEYYTHIADLLRIFLDNALKHSKASDSQINVEIVVKKIGDTLSIVIANESADMESVAKLPKIQDSKNHTEKLSTEGRSGFYKAQKILMSDLKNDIHGIDLAFDDEENKFIVSFSLGINILKV